MANHEGWYLKVNTDISGLLQANKAANSLLATLRKVDAGSSLHGNDSLAKTMKSADVATASYIERLKSAGKIYEANQEKVKLYQSQIQRLNDRQRGLNSELERLASVSGKNSDAYNVQRTRINQTKTAINEFNAKIKTTQSEMSKLRPTGFNAFTAGAQKINSATDKIKSKVHSAWQSIKGGATVATAGFAAVGAAAMSGAKQMGSLQQTYKEISNLAVTGGEKQRSVTKSVMEMQRQGRDMSIKYGKSQQSIAAAYEDLVKRGYTTKQAVGALRTEVQASVASGDKLSDVTTVSSQVLDAFGMRANSTSKMLSNTKKVVNELAYSADATSTGFGDLGVAMSYVGTAAKSNKISLAETASALGVLSNNGLESDKAGTALRSTINGLTNQINKIGKKNSIFTKLGIKKSDMLDAHGNLKSLSTDMSVLFEAIKKHSSGGAQQNSFYKAIFGTSGMNGAEILAKYSSEVESLTKRTEKAGKTGTYVSQLANKNMGTAQGNIARTKQAMNAFKMTLGNALLPAISQASDSLAKFLLSKDGKQFQKDVGGAVGKVANALVNFIKFAATHKTTMKAIGESILIGYSISKGAKFVSFLGDVKKGIDALKGGGAVLRGISDAAGGLSAGKSGGGLVSKVISHGASKGVTSAAEEGPMGSTAGTAAGKTGLMGRLFGGLGKAGAGRAVLGGTFAKVSGVLGTGIEAGGQLISAINDRHSASKRSQDIGGGVGAVVGGVATSMIPYVGPLLAPFGAMIGKYAGRWGGKAVNNFTKGWQSKKPPKKFWSMENLGWSTRDMFGKIGRGWNSFWGKRGDDMKAFGRSSGKWFSGIGKGFNNGVKGVKGWFTKLPSNIGKAGTAVKNWASKAGSNIHRGWDKGIKAGHNFFKNLPKNTGKAVKSMKKNWNSFWGKAGDKVKAGGRKIQKGWNNTWKAVNRNRYVKAFKKGRFVQTAFKDMKSRLGSFRKDFSKKWGSFWSGVGKTAKKDWNGTKRNWNNFWGSMPKKWNNFKKDFGKNWSSFWGGIGKGFSNFISGIQKGWNNFWGSIGKNLGKFKDWASNSWTGTKNNVKGFANDIVYFFGGSKHTFKYDKFKGHAKGGHFASAHSALVGEAGPELAYRVNGNARLLGANGPELTRVRSGEHILNARDTHKVLHGGLGSGLALAGYAQGNTKLTRKVSNDYKDISTKSGRSLKNLAKTSNSTWRKITRQTNRQTDKTRKDSIADYRQMHKGINKQMDAMHDGVIKLAKSTAKGFGNALHKMKNYAKDAMSDTIGQLNKGINSIDKVLSQFGGNSSVIKPIKFAKGTDSNGRLTKNTLAMLNDADSGPRQEAVVTENNEILMPRGRNTVMPLKRGWGVLNGTQTRQLGLTHFAKGSGVSHSELKKIAARNGANPAKSFAELFTKLLRPGKSDLSHGTTGLANNSSTHFGVPWNNAMWTVINDAIGGASGKGGTREAFLKYAESTFSGVRYVMGAASKAASDCSGMVMQALRHFGINIGRSTVDMQHSAGVQYLGKSLANTIPGDLVIFGHGTGAAGHVGIIKNPKTGTMFNETPPHARVTRIADDKGMGYGYYRVRGLHNASSSKGKGVKADKRLIALAKHQLGPAALKWIKDKLGDEGSLGGNIGGEGVKRWAGTVRKILGMLHLSTSDSMVNRVLRQINTESGGNPHAMGGTDGLSDGHAEGLMQVKPPTFAAYHRKGANNIWNGPDNIYAGLNYAKHRYGNSLSFLGNGHGYAVGGDAKAGEVAMVGEKGPELVQFKQSAHVYSNERSKQLSYDDLLDKSKRPQKTRSRKGQTPVINININGPISSRSDATKYGKIIKAKIAEVIYDLFGEEFGGDPSIY